jgi:hypothetical protein
MSVLERVTRKALFDFIERKPRTPYKIALSPNVSIIISRANRNSIKVFDFGIEVDEDSGGWTGALYIDNISLCVADKTAKIQAYKSRYAEWWLVLVDYLLGGIGEPEKTSVIQNINIGPAWKKLVVIHPTTKEEILIIRSSDLIPD